MKTFFYIILSTFLVLACGSGREPKARQQTVDSITLPFGSHRLDKKIILQPKAMEKQVQDTLQQADFDILAQQKLQQFFDMLRLLKQNKPGDFKALTQKQIQKLWINQDHLKRFLQKNPVVPADSLIFDKLQFVNFKARDMQELAGNYLLKYTIYRQGKAHSIQTRAQFYFQISDLDLDGQRYQTLKAKILKID